MIKSATHQKSRLSRAWLAVQHNDVGGLLIDVLHAFLDQIFPSNKSLFITLDHSLVLLSNMHVLI